MTALEGGAAITTFELCIEEREKFEIGPPDVVTAGLICTTPPGPAVRNAC